MKTINKHRTLTFHLILILIFLIFNIIFSKNNFAAIYGAVKFFEFVFFGFFTIYKIRDINFNLALLALSIGVFFQSLLSTFQYIKQSSLGGILYFFGERTFNGQTPGIANISAGGDLILRAYGTFSHPNVLAGFLLITLTLLIFNLRLKKITDSFYLTSVILGSVALFLTFSRIAILLWIITLCIFLFSKVKISLFKKVIAVLIVLASLLISSVIYSPFYFRFIQSSLFEESFVVREKIIYQSFDIFTKNPIIGAGINNYFSLPISLNNVFVIQPVHNIFMLILVQTGIIGFLYSLWFLLKLFKSVINKPVALKLLLFYIIAIGVFDHYFLTLQQGQLMLSFLIGYILSKKNE